MKLRPSSVGQAWVIAASVTVAGCGSPSTTNIPAALASSALASGQVTPSPASSRTAPPTVAGERLATGDTVAAIDATTGRVIDVFRVGPDPKLTEVAAGRVWTLDLESGGLSRIDPATRAVTRVPVNGQAVGIAADGEDLWVTHDGRLLSRVDGATGEVEATIALADEPIFASRNAGFVAVASATAWLTVPVLGRALQPHDLWEVDLATGSVLDRSEIGRDPLWPAVGGGALWVPVGSDGVVRLDLESRERIHIGDVRFAVGVAVGDGAVWVADAGGQRVLGLSPIDGAVLADVPVDAPLRGITVGGGSVWATTEAGLSEIDPATSAVRRSVALVEPVRREFGPTDPVYLDGVVWVPIE